MGILSTRCMDNFKKKDDLSDEVKTSPKKQTLELLRQFARAYRVEPVLRPELCGFILN